VERLNPEFLSTMAQISATFIGFAFLVPAFQAVALGKTNLRYVLKKRFLMKWFLLIFLPVIVFGKLLIFALLLLNYTTSAILLEYCVWCGIIFYSLLLWVYRCLHETQDVGSVIVYCLR
jgi:hypothetical protein